jgi:hypothetical protein
MGYRISGASRSNSGAILKAEIVNTRRSRRSADCARAFGSRSNVALPLNAQREGGSEVLSGPTQARRYETTFRPHEADVSDVGYKFVENRDHVRMAEFIGKRDLRKQANSNSRQNTRPDRFDTVGRKISIDGHAESTIWSYKGPIR